MTNDVTWILDCVATEGWGTSGSMALKQQGSVTKGQEDVPDPGCLLERCCYLRAVQNCLWCTEVEDLTPNPSQLPCFLNNAVVAGELTSR